MRTLPLLLSVAALLIGAAARAWAVGLDAMVGGLFALGCVGFGVWLERRD